VSEASVFIVADGGPIALRRCLDALEAQTQDPATFEVIVVDGSSALAAAVETATGRICIFLGDDVAATPKLIAAHLAGQATDAKLVGVGRLTQEVPGGRDWYARATAMALNQRFDSSNAPRVDWLDLRLRNFSVARGALDGTSGFAELASRLDSAGYAVRYLPEAHGIRRCDVPGRRLLTERAEDGAARAELAGRDRSRLPVLVGSFFDGSPRELALRRLMLALRVRPAVLAALGRLLPGERRKGLWFIFVSNFAFWDAVRKHLAPDEWTLLSRGVPVLLYHAFSESDESSRFVVTRRVFARQMRLLSLLRFTVLPYGEFARSLREGGRLPSRTAVLTIDDGYADNGELAAPILERHGFGATIFAVTDCLGAINDWSDAAPLRGRRLLSVQQLAPLHERGIEFGAHTRTHASLPDLPDEAVAEEVESSRAELERALGAPIYTFAYPYGRLDDRAIAAVQRAGFLSACTTEPRLACLGDHPLLIPRLEIKRADSLWRFLRKVWFGGA
jgi:peptidoglycan/xylan/chitin deacetylase (PgdA/CDA1 family)